MFTHKKKTARMPWQCTFLSSTRKTAAQGGHTQQLQASIRVDARSKYTGRWRRRLCYTPPWRPACMPCVDVPACTSSAAAHTTHSQAHCCCCCPRRGLK
jgi:hypothetical protein